MNLSKLKKKWSKRWMDAKDDIVETLSDPEVQNEWKREVLSPTTIKKRRERLLEAINAGLIEAGLAEVDPAEWASQTIEGVQSKTITEIEEDEWEKNFAPYASVIKQGKAQLERLGKTGRDALLWWYDNVSKKLHNMKLEKGKRFVGRKAEIVEVA